jgi:plasmid stabilization system protein ParE
VWRTYDYIYDFNPPAAACIAEAPVKAGGNLVNFPHRGRPVRGTTMRELVTINP